MLFLENSEILNTLLYAGANVNSRDYDQQTPLHRAALLMGHTALLSIPRYDPKSTALKQKEIVKTLISKMLLSMLYRPV